MVFNIMPAPNTITNKMGLFAKDSLAYEQSVECMLSEILRDKTDQNDISGSIVTDRVMRYA